MTDVVVEVTEKKVVAWACDWPGWCRIRRDEAQALQALTDWAPRYQRIAERAGMEIATAPLRVVARVAGDGKTAWGVPSVLAPCDTRPWDAPTVRRQTALLEAAWALFAEVAAHAPAELRKGPRGGGRDRDAVVAHVIEAERAYARKIGVRHPPFAPDDAVALHALRRAIVDALVAPGDGMPLVDGGWVASYAARRIGWHVVDHLWEIEDRGT